MSFKITIRIVQRSEHTYIAVKDLSYEHGKVEIDLRENLQNTLFVATDIEDLNRFT